MKRGILLTTFLLIVLCAHGQVENNENVSSISLRYGASMNFSSEYNSYSTGGNWGLQLDHNFLNSRYGFIAGIGFNLINLGWNNSGYTPPSEAAEFKLLDSQFGLSYRPFKFFDDFKISLGYVHGLVLSTTWYVENYNLSQGFFGLEYIIPAEGNLAFSIGVESRAYQIFKQEFGSNISTILVFKIGLKR